MNENFTNDPKPEKIFEEGIQRTQIEWNVPHPREVNVWSQQWKVLGFHDCKRGIDVNPAHIIAISEMNSPRSVKDIQRFNVTINYLSLF